MNIRALKTLVAIEQIGGFAAVAARLGLTVSAVSLQMKTLEDELQVALFDRSHRPPRLTPIGRRVAAHAATILAEQEAIRAAASEDEGLHGDLRIGAVGTASVRLMPQFLATARRRHPSARIGVSIDTSAALERRLLEGALDAAVVTKTHDIPDGLTFRRLRRERFAIAAPTTAGTTALARLAEALPLVQFTPSTGIGLLVAQHLRGEGVRPAERLTLDSVEAVMGCVTAGVGFAILPEPDVARYGGPDVAQAPVPDLERELGIAARTDSPMARLVETLADLFEPG